MTELWYRNPGILFEKYDEFFPNKNLNRMEKLKKQLEDIKGALPLMIKLGAIDQSAYKTLEEALTEALQQYDVMQRSEQLIAFCDW